MIFLTLSIFANQKNLCHALLNRHGGTSTPPHDTLNVSFGVGDTPLAVCANRQKVKDTLRLDILVSAKQVHADKILIIDTKQKADLEEDSFDALITNVPNIGLLIQQADCQAVMLFDPVKKVIANIHSGWKGSTLNIIGTTIQKMVERFGTEPAHLLAGISPSLGPCCAEFIHYKKELPKEMHRYQIQPNYFDFWEISRDQLTDAGVETNNIEIAQICTVCDHDYFSYRRDKITGRFGSIIALK